jgi:hypothetical protein
MHHLLDILSRADIRAVAAILRYNLLLVGHILDPVDVFCSGAAHLAFNREGGEASENQNGCAPARGIVDCSTEALSANVDMHDDALRLSR